MNYVYGFIAFALVVVLVINYLSYNTEVKELRKKENIL